jgi:hypothetical protein
MRPVLFALLAAGCVAFAQVKSGAIFSPIPITTPPANRVAATPGHVLAPPPAARGVHSHHGGGRTVVVPYPVYVGGYYDAPPAYAPPPADSYNDSEAAPSPIVIINQNFRPDTANPVIHDYSNVRLPEPGPSAADQPDPPPTIYLIAMRDHTIFPALAYWVDGDTLNYITTEGVHNRATLDLVDRDFSKQLNDERHVEFKLPKAK